jgi:hypothetical protein
LFLISILRVGFDSITHRRWQAAGFTYHGHCNGANLVFSTWQPGQAMYYNPVQSSLRESAQAGRIFISSM